MRTKVMLAAAALAAGLSPGVAHAQAEAQCGEALNLENADIRSVVDEIAMRTGKKFVLDPRVAGNVTIKSGPNGGLCADEAWELFQASLRVIGFIATPINGDSYRIVPLQEGARSAGAVGPGDEAGSFTTQIIRLNFVDAREAAANLTQIISERGVVAPVRSSNSLIIVDTEDNVRRLRNVIAQIDRDTTVYRTIQLSNASASEVARVVGDMAKELQEEGSASAKATVVPVSGSNSVLIRAEPNLIGRLASVVADLDRIGETRAELTVVGLSHADAEEMTTLLREIVTAQAADPAQTGPSKANISFHKATNSVIISGDASTQQALKKVVEQLDVRRAQVQIEAVIVEVSDSTAKNLGIEYFLAPLDGKRVPFTATNFASASPNVLAAAGALLLNPDLIRGSGGSTGSSDSSTLSDTLATSAVSSLLATNGFIAGAGGEIGDDAVFGAVLSALKRDTDSNVLSLPSVVTLDNQEASLSVGQEIPITTGEAVGDNFSNAFRQVERKEVGIILEVTPQINEGGTVTLKIRQETSSVAGQIVATSTDLITNKREISTTALVDDGDVLVLGGLVDQNDSDTEDKVPLLGDIPFAGNLFKSTNRTRQRRNLMVFIRPTILRDQAAAERVTRKKLDYINAREILRTGEPVSELDRLIEQVTGPADALPPAPGSASPQ